MSNPPAESEAAPRPDEVNRLWQHGMHEERLFYDRLNYFSAIQVGLLGVFAILYHKEPSVGVFVPLTAAALAFALLWLRVQVRHWRYCVHVNEQIRRAVPEYARTVSAFAAPGRKDGLSISRPLAFAVPLLFAATWLALFGWVLARSCVTERVCLARAAPALSRCTLGGEGLSEPEAQVLKLRLSAGRPQIGERRGVSPPVQALPGPSPLSVESARPALGYGCCSGPCLHRRAYAAPLAGDWHSR